MHEQNSGVEHITGNQHHSTVQTVQQTERQMSFFKKMWVSVCVSGVILSCEEPTHSGGGGITPLFIHRLLGTGNRRQGQYIIANTPAPFPAAHTSSQSPGKITDHLYGEYFSRTRLPTYTSTQNTQTHTHKLVDWMSGQQAKKRKSTQRRLYLKQTP